MTALSHGEAEALVRRAARGAGRSWGMAEEAGHAARWLNERGQPGTALVAGLLAETDGKTHDAMMLRCSDDNWTPTGDAICPLVLGTALSDRATVLPPVLMAGPVLYPLLLAPCLATIAFQTGRPQTLAWADVRICVTGADLCVQAGADHMARATEARVTLEQDAPAAGPALPCTPRADVADAVAKRLTALAARTYAPDTPERRMSGAGAGLTDND